MYVCRLECDLLSCTRLYMWVSVTSLSMLMSLSLCVCVCLCASERMCPSFSAARGAFACLREGNVDFNEIFFFFCLGFSVVVIKTGDC